MDQNRGRNDPTVAIPPLWLGSMEGKEPWNQEEKAGTRPGETVGLSSPLHKVGT